MKNYIIPVSKGGLAGRLKCLITSIKISERTNRNLLLYWPKNPPCNCYFSDLFENNIKELSKEELRKIIKENEFQILKKSERTKINKKFILVGDVGFSGFSNESLPSNFQEIPGRTRKEIIEILKRLKIKRNFKKEIDKFCKIHFKGNLIGVHIRRGDFKRITNNVGKVSSDEKFFEEMRREIALNPKTKFFLATEEKETEEKFINFFGNRIILYPKKTKEREEEGAVKEALIELLLLSRCTKIFGSFGSAFTEFAWFFGECKPEIKMIIDERELKKYNIKERKKANLFNKIKKIIYETITPLHVRLLDKI